MISYEEALKIVLRYAVPLGTVHVELGQAAGSFVARAVQTATPMPRFDNSAVDGYGVNVSDTSDASMSSPVRLEVKQIIRAGESHVMALERGCAARISTGGPIPPGVNAVVMREEVDESEAIVIRRSIRLGANIRRAGEEFRAGAVVIAAGSRVTPGMVGLLARLGDSSVEVYRRPSAALIISGNELVPAGKPLAATQEYDSNTPSLRAALDAAGVQSISSYVIGDSIEPLRDCLEQAFEAHDLVITAGGISMGDSDYVRTVLASIGVQQRYWQVAIKPGKPNYFGTCAVGPERHRLVFGLPGNPVSALVSFLLFVRPALRQIMGNSCPAAELFSARLGKEIRSEVGRLEFIRGRLSTIDGDWMVQPTDGQGSHMLAGLATADCLIHCPPESRLMAAGDTVQVQRIEW